MAPKSPATRQLAETVAGFAVKSVSQQDKSVRLRAELAEDRKTIESLTAPIAVIPDDWLPDGAAERKDWLQGD